MPSSSRTVTVSAIALLASARVVAAPPTLEAPLESLEPAGLDCVGAVHWEQLPNGASALATQDDPCYPFTAETADDFEADGSPLLSISWWGVYWGGSPGTIDHFDLFLRADGPDGTPGEVVWEYRTADYHQVVGDPLSYCATLPLPLPTVPGMTYHLTARPEYCYPPQWGAATGDGNGRQGHFRGELFGYPDWVPMEQTFGVPYELAFSIRVDPPVPIEEGSWARLKALFAGGIR